MKLTKILKDPRTAISATVLSLVGMFGLMNNGEIHEYSCKTFQGYRESGADVSITYIFDPQTLETRGLRPELGLVTNSDLRDNLQIGKKYDLRTFNPILGRERLVSYKACEEESQQNI